MECFLDEDLLKKLKIRINSDGQSMEKEEGTFGKVMLGRWMESNFWWCKKEDEDLFRDETKQSPINHLIKPGTYGKVMLRRRKSISRPESYRMDSDHLLKTNLNESRPNQIILWRQVKCYSVTISGKFGVEQLIHSRLYSHKTEHGQQCYQRSRKSNQTTIGINKDTGQVA